MSTFFIVQLEHPERIFSPDSASYIKSAQALLDKGRFLISPDMPEIPQLIRTPGYPFFIATVFRLSEESYVALLVTQILISIGTVLVTYKMAAMIWNPRIGLLSALLLSLDLPSFISSQQVLTETLFTFILCCALISLLFALKKPQKMFFPIFLFGIFLSLATLIRPITLYIIYPACATTIILLRIQQQLQWKKVISLALLLLVPWITMIGGWQLRNYRLVGKADFCYIQAANLLFYRGADILAQRDRIGFEDAQRLLGYHNFLNMPPERLRDTLVELSQQWQQESFRLFLQHPYLLLKSQIRGFFKMMLMPGENSLLAYLKDYHEDSGPIGDVFKLPFSSYMQKWLVEKRGHFILFSIALIHLGALYVGMIVSLWSLRAKRDSIWSGHLFFGMVLLYLIAISAGPEAYFRFRIPVLPICSMYSGHGLVSIFRAMKIAK